MFKKLFAVKQVDKILEEAHNNKGLKKTLTATNLIAIGIGAIIGTGIFVITGTAAAQYAGPALSISFLISAVLCLFVAFCYTEFAAMIPISGSAYSYAYATMGEFIAWFIGWNLILEYLFGSSMVAVGWSGYMVSFLKDFGINIPQTICQAPLTVDSAGIHTTGAIINLPAIFIVVLLTTVIIFGIKESVKFNNIIVLIKLIVILLFVGFGFSYIDTSNYTPFIPENTGDWGSFGWSGVIRASGIIFLAYVGFDAISTVAQEAKNPQRDMPRSILGSLLIVTILYVIVSLVLTGIVNYKDLNVPDPIAVGIDKAGEALLWLRPIIKIGAIAGISSVILVLLTAQPRIFYAMSVDGMMPKVFGKIHKKYGTPYITIIIVGGVVATLSGLFPLEILAELVSIGTLLAFMIVCVGIVVLRIRKPELKRPFKTPLVYIIAPLGAVGCVYLMASLPVETWLRLLIWTIIGLVIYFTYGIRNSKNHNQ